MHNKDITNQRQGEDLLVCSRERISEELKKLATGLDGRSETGRIREVMDWIEIALSSGVNRRTVFDTLRENLKLKMRFKTFETTLHRVRKERRGQVKKNSYPVSTATTSTEIALIRNNPNNTTDNQLIIHTDNGNYPSPVVEDEWEDNQEVSYLEYRKNIGKDIDPKEAHACVERFREMKRKEKKGKK